MPRAAVTEALGSGPSRVRVADSKSAVIGADDLILEPPLLHLYRYLREAGCRADRGGSGVTIDRLVPVENADAPELLDHGQTERGSIERGNAIRELLPPPRCLFVAEIGNDELAETPEQMEVGRAQVRNDLPQNGE